MAVQLASPFKKKRLNSEINITPLVDVMLVLLIIFMVTAPMMITGVAVDLPAVNAEGLPEQNEPLVLSIDSKGQIYLQDHKIELANLPQKLEAIALTNKNNKILVRADHNLSYGYIMKIFGALQSSKYYQVSLVTEAED